VGPIELEEKRPLKPLSSANMAAGLPAEGAENAALVARHHAWVSSMWGRACAPEAHIGLAQIYETTPEFQARYETIAKGFTTYFCAAMRALAA